MDRNLFLAFGLSFAVLLLWTLFVDPPPPPVPATNETEVSELEVPGAPATLPELAPAPAEVLGVAPALPPMGATQEVASRRITFETSLFRAELDTRGAGITSWELREYNAPPREGGAPIQLMTGEAPFATGLVTRFSELGLGDLSQVVFEVVSEDHLAYAFRYTQNGVSVLKEYAFDAERYAFELRVSVENAGQTAVDPRFAVSWPVALADGNDFREQAAAAYVDGDLEVQLVSALGKGSFFGNGEQVTVHNEGAVEWTGMQSPYFVAAVLPDQPTQASARFVAIEEGVSGVAELYFEPLRLPPGQSATRTFQAYVGPKEPERLAAVGPALVGSIDLGWSWVKPLTRFFHWMLSALHVFIPNYGVAIIVLTILVRLVTAPLTAKQMRSMERMRTLQPQLNELKEKHGDDKQKQSEEMMRLYKQEGVNPLGGCLPMILQLPVFIGLFYSLRSSIQLRQAPFFGWIDDLSAPDTLFDIPGLDLPLRVLPLVMGASMLVQQKITPMQSMDPTQQKMMTIIMPIMMTVLFYQFPSGLVLYWMVSNVLAIAHQLWIGRHLRQ
ncbi:MAG: membrane protein insertase YidC [Deltaproteobacteria bacterium]|nr:membrane protein insertase YidC [Deltaproteobacteria bacterium]